MQRLRANRILLVLTIAVLLWHAAPRLPADTVTWDGDCGSGSWYDCCTCNEDPCLKCNNWAVTPNAVSCPWCPSSPTIDDDVILAAGAVTLDQGAAVRSLTTAGGFTLDAGGVGLSVDNSATFGGPLTWLSGWLAAAAGPGTRYAYADGGLFITGAGQKRLIEPIILYNSYLAIWDGPGHIELAVGAVFYNLPAALFDVRNDAEFNWVGDVGLGYFENAGRFIKSAGTGATRCSYAEFDNLSGGTVEVQTGHLEFAAGGTSSGVFIIAAGSTVRIASLYTFDAGTTVTGAGTVSVADGNGNLAVPQAVVIDIPKLELAGGYLSGRGEQRITDTFDWLGGTLTIAAGAGEYGSTRVAPGATLSISGTGFKQIYRRVLYNGGTATWTGAGDVLLYDTNEGEPPLRNLAGAVFDIQNDQSITPGWGTAAGIDNAGLFVKSAGAGTTAIGVPYATSGETRIESGTLSFYTTFAQTAGATRLAGGSLACNAGLELLGGLLAGSGTITGSVSNVGGEVGPGASPGSLMLIGNYTQAPAGAMTFEIGGPLPGTEHDQVVVSGSAELAGTISVSLIDGFVPDAGDALVLMTYASHTGSFEVVNLPAALPDLRFGLFVEPTRVVLRVGLTGDTNCDGVVDFDDINPFVLALSDPDAYQAAYPDCFASSADCDGDGDVDFEDINPFVALLSGS